MTRAVLGIAGLGLLAYGAYGLVTAQGDASRQVLFAAALLAGHEGILMPVAIAVGWVAVRVVPSWARAVAQVALLVTLALILIAIPMLVLAGTFPDLPSLLPLDYRRGLLIAIGVTWLIAVAIAVANRWRSRSGDAGGDG